MKLIAVTGRSGSGKTRMIEALLAAKEATAIGLDHSLVFVDRPDLHVDDLDHLVGGLASLGKDNQLFLAGRPELAAAAGGAHIVTLKGA